MKIKIRITDGPNAGQFVRNSGWGDHRTHYAPGTEAKASDFGWEAAAIEAAARAGRQLSFTTYQLTGGADSKPPAARRETRAGARPRPSHQNITAAVVVKLRSSISPTRDQYLAYTADCWLTVPPAEDATRFPDRRAAEHAVHRARRYLRIRDYEIDRR